MADEMAGSVVCCAGIGMVVHALDPSGEWRVPRWLFLILEIGMDKILVL